MTSQEEMFPDMPCEAPRKRKRLRKRPVVWFYVQSVDGRRMLSTDPYSGEFCFIPLDLGCPRILLFASEWQAEFYAFKQQGEHVKYPYNTFHLYNR